MNAKVAPSIHYAASRGKRLGPRPVVVALILMIALGSVAFWAKGRGYKYALIRRFFPDSNAALVHPSIRDIRPGDHAGNVSPYAFIACDLNLPNSGKVVDGS